MPERLETRLRRLRDPMEAAMREAASASPARVRTPLAIRGRVVATASSIAIVAVGLAVLVMMDDGEKAASPSSSEVRSAEPAITAATLAVPGYEAVFVEDYVVGAGETSRYRSVTYERVDSDAEGPVIARLTTTTDPGWSGDGEVQADARAVTEPCLGAAVGDDGSGRDRLIYRDPARRYVRVDVLWSTGGVLSLELWYGSDTPVRPGQMLDLYGELEPASDAAWSDLVASVPAVVTDPADASATWASGYDLIAASEAGADRLVREPCVLAQPRPNR